jgi:hypothetical protein
MLPRARRDRSCDGLLLADRSGEERAETGHPLGSGLRDASRSSGIKEAQVELFREAVAALDAHIHNLIEDSLKE